MPPGTAGFTIGDMTGKLTSKGRQTRQRIVAAAAGLMFEGGVAGTTMEDVRAAAGVSSSQVYHYFTDKEALVRAVIEFQNETVVGGQEDLLARLDTLAGLRAWRDFLVARQRALDCRGGCPIGSLGSELAETDPRALQGGLLLTQIRRSTEPLEAALDTVLAHVALLLVPAAD